MRYSIKLVRNVINSLTLCEYVFRLDKIGIHDAASRTAECVNDVGLDTPTRRIWAANYIEIVAR